MTIGIGIGIDKSGPIASGPSYNAAYQALLDKLTTDGVSLPDDTQKEKDNTLINTLENAGQLTTHAAMYILGWHQHEAALYNWITPAANKCSYIGSMTSSEFTAGVGYKTKAASALNTSVNPSTSATIDADNCTLWMWVQGLSAKDIYMGVSNGSNFCYLGNEGGTIYTRINTNGAENSGTIGASRNFIAVKRISSTDVEIWENGTLVATITRNFTAIANDVIYLCAMKFGGSVYGPSANVDVYAAGIGGDVDVATVYAAILTHKS